MFKRNSRIKSNTTDISNYVEDYDIYNSVLFRSLNNPILEKSSYLITNYQLRPDLIAKDFYGSAEYEGLLLLQCPIPITEFKKGLVLRLIPKQTLDSLINSLV